MQFCGPAGHMREQSCKTSETPLASRRKLVHRSGRKQCPGCMPRGRSGACGTNTACNKSAIKDIFCKRGLPDENFPNAPKQIPQSGDRVFQNSVLSGTRSSELRGRLLFAVVLASEFPAQLFGLLRSGKPGTVHLAEHESIRIFSTAAKHRRVESDTDVPPFLIFESLPT